MKAKPPSKSGPGRRRRSAPALADQALVLRRFPFGESSLMVHLITPHYGRVVALAKGAYRPKSGYCGVLDLFDQLEVSWRPARTSNVAVMRSASLDLRRRGISGALDRYRVGCACLEIAGIGSIEGQADPELFALLSGTLQVLHEASVDARLVGIAFDLGFLNCMGLEPALEHCCSCGQDLSGERLRRVPFSAALGGRLCSACCRGVQQQSPGRATTGRLAAGLEEIPRPVLRVARSLCQTPLSALARIHLDTDLAAELERFVRGFVEYHLERRPRSRASLPPPPACSG